MNITQETVDRIIKRAEQSAYGLDEGLTYKAGHLKIDQYSPQDLNALAMLLINGWHAKYDLISVVRAALEVIAEDARRQVFTETDDGAREGRNA